MLSKKDLRTKIGETAGVDTKEVHKVLDATIEVVKNELKSGEKVSVHGLCTFSPKTTPAGERTFRNPRTGESVTKFYEESTVVKVKAEKSLLRLINEK